VAAPLTISDIRRARRATGLSLDELAAVAEVPAARLRELEWGYLRNWKLDDAGRAQVIRYARAAGLDEAVVLSIAWPMIEDAAALRDGPPEAVVALVPSGPQALAIVRGRRSRSRLVSWGGAAAVAASLALATFGLVTGMANDGHPARVAAISEPAVATPVAPSAAAPLPAAAPPQPAARRPAARHAAPRQAARPVHASSRRSSPPSRSFLNKELFRIVIR